MSPGLRRLGPRFGTAGSEAPMVGWSVVPGCGIGGELLSRGWCSAVADWERDKRKLWIILLALVVLSMVVTIVLGAVGSPR